jgi:hypothetical protein
MGLESSYLEQEGMVDESKYLGQESYYLEQDRMMSVGSPVVMVLLWVWPLLGATRSSSCFLLLDHCGETCQDSAGGSPCIQAPK